MRIRLLAILILCSVQSSVFVACGKRKLTEEQKAQVAKTLDSTSRTYGAAPQSSSTSVAQRSQRFMLASVPPLSLSSMPTQHFLSSSWINRSAVIATSKTMDEDTQKMNTQISAAIQDGRCTLSNTGDKSGEAFGSASFSQSLQITGGSCPIALNIAVSGNKVQLGGEFEITLKYVVNDDTFRSFNDIDRFEFSEKFGYQINISQNLASGSIKANLRGQIHSQQKGDIKIELDADLVLGSVSMTSTQSNSSLKSNLRGTVRLSLEFSDFTAEFKQTFESGKIKYEVNDVELSEDDFKQYFKQFKLGFKYS